MKKICIIILILIGFANTSYSAITFTDGKWENTWDCSEWEGPLYPGTVCGIERWDNIAATGGLYDQVTSAANYTGTGSGGGRGLREWVVGDGDLDDITSASDGWIIRFQEPVYEVWARFYMRFESGFYFYPDDTNGHKLLYFKKFSDWSNLSHVSLGQEIYWGDGVHFERSGTIWADYFGDGLGGDVTNGQWVCVEVHVKSETVLTAPFDGQFQIWLNGDLIINSQNVDTGIFSGGYSIGGFTPQHNYHKLPPFGPKYSDFDEMVIYNTTPPNQDALGNPYIGPLDTAPTYDAPIVTILTASQSTTAETITIIGTLVTGSALTGTGVTVNGATATSDDGAWNESVEAWTATDVPLSLGANTITASGTDSAAQVDTDSITVTRTTTLKSSKIHGTATIKNAVIHQ